jgi:hypothetical protein
VCVDAGRRGAWTALARALLLACLAAAGGTRAAETEVALERRVKAAFLYQFVPYVEWTATAFPQADSPIVIAVAGPDASVAEFADVIGKRSAQGRPVVVRRWRESDLQGGAHVVFVTRAESGRTPALARAAQQSGTLLVAEHEGALDQGAMIGFRIVDGRVRFDVALGPAERAGLRISSRLLTVAQSVRPVPP